VSSNHHHRLQRRMTQMSPWNYPFSCAFTLVDLHSSPGSHVVILNQLCLGLPILLVP
ncbi:hypothetical protein SK128_027604, partial [Halocaridina rubra]